MQRFESMEDAVRVAVQILAGEMDPNLGCGLIRGISQGTNFPDELDAFLLLGHEQHDHEHLGITAESCIPEILEACRELVARRQA
jgi:hypothetical protein